MGSSNILSLYVSLQLSYSEFYLPSFLYFFLAYVSKLLVSLIEYVKILQDNFIEIFIYCVIYESI